MGAVRPTGRGLALLTTALVALLVAGRWQVEALRPVAGLLLGLLLLALVAVLLVPRRLTVERTSPTRVLDQGDVASARVAVANRSPVQSLDLRWRADLPPGLGGPATGEIGSLGPARSGRASAEAFVRVGGESRGRHALGPLVIEVRDPFGVVVRRRRIDDDVDVVVLPRRVPLPRLSAVHGSTAARTGRASARRRGDGEDDVVSRTYQPGDAPRRIDWRTTARRGELMVRQDESVTVDQVAVAVDVGTEPGPAEWALVAAASAMSHFAHDGHAVATLVPGGESGVLSGADALEGALVALAELTHGGGGPVEGAPQDRRPVVAVLGVVTVARAREWVAALRRSEQVRALVAGHSGDAVLDVLRSAGWRVVAWDETDDVVTAWTALGREVTRATA